MPGRSLHAVERGRRIDVPEGDQRARAAAGRAPRASSSSSNTPTPLALTTRSAPRACSSVRSAAAVVVARVDHDLRPRRIGHVAVLLAVERVGLVERDAVAALVQRADDAAVVGGGAVPVGGDEAGAEEGDVSSARVFMGEARSASVERRLRFSSATMASSSSTRCAQVCRAQDRLAAACAASARCQLRVVQQVDAGARASRAPSRATRKSLPGENRSSASSHGARDQRDAAGQRLEHADGRECPAAPRT